MNSSRLFFFIAAIITCSFILQSSASAQVKTQSAVEDVVYFKNGTILRGKVLEFDPVGNVKVEILGGSVFVFPSSDVIKIVEEPKVFSFNPIIEKRPFVFKTKGFGNITQLGFTQGGVSLDNITNYCINPRLVVGAGIGFDRMEWQIKLAPVFADIRGDILPKSRVTPFYFGQAGYAFPLHSNWVTNFQGGFMASLGMGVKFNTRNASRWMVSICYRMEKAKYTTSTWWGFPQEINATFLRMNFKVGFAF